MAYLGGEYPGSNPPQNFLAIFFHFFFYHINFAVSTVFADNFSGWGFAPNPTNFFYHINIAVSMVFADNFSGWGFAPNPTRELTDKVTYYLHF